jgi:cohesin loading factor subunit SCC2
VKAALQKRVQDSSITTREAVVDLIGTFILQSQRGGGNALVDADYFNFIVGRLNDTGISVRKKVVRILRDLCLQPQPHPRYSELAERLILCVRDSEESMQSLSVTIVYEMWFDRQQSHVRDRLHTAKLEPTVKTEGQLHSLAKLSSPFTPQFQQLVHLIVGVMSAYHTHFQHGQFAYACLRALHICSLTTIVFVCFSVQFTFVRCTRW